LIPWFSDPFNFWAVHLGTKVLLTGTDPFSLFVGDPRFRQLGPWPYPAEYFLFAIAAYGGSGGVPFLFGVWLRIPTIAADAGTSILLFRILKQLGGSDRLARNAAIAFLFNPFSIIVTAIWGQNDPITVFFSVLALHFFLRKTDRDVIWGSFVLGLGIATKVYPFVFLPVALALVPGVMKKLRVLGIAALPPALTSAPFLLSDFRSYLGIIFGFAGGTSGSNRAQLDPQLTAWRVISWFTGPLDSTLAFVAAGGLVLGLFWTYRLVRSGRLDVTTAFGLVILVSYLPAVRWSPNYFLWAVPFVTASALRQLRGIKKWVTMGLWIPALSYALIFNGWYPDPYSGGSGLSYWTLISGVQGTRGHEALPPELVPGLIAATVLVAFVVALVLFRSVRIKVQQDSKPAITEESPPRPFLDPSSTRRITALVSLLFVVLFVASVAYQSSHGRPVNPSDFANFDVLPDGSFRLTDQFRADILSFRWVFHGTGRYSLHSNGTSGILVDTSTPNGTAYIENDLAADRISIRIVFRPESLYGTQPLQILRANSTWLGVVPTSGSGGMLTLFDEIANRSFDLGAIGSSWIRADLGFSPLSQDISVSGANFTLPPMGPIPAVYIGQTDPLEDGGGQFVVAEVSMVWSRSQALTPQLSPWLVLVADIAVLVPLLEMPDGRRKPRVKPPQPGPFSSQD